MSLRKPFQTVLDYNDSGNVGATSIVSKTFFLPQDTDNVVLKIPTASVNGSAPVVDVFLQTSDDGGSTFYDVACVRLPSTVTSSVLFANNTTAPWVSAATVFKSSVAGSAAASSLGANQVSGLPILSEFGRVSIKYSGTITANNGVRVQVSANQQSPRS